ncbi:MAG: methyltransferase domain-containing protein [Candidatus Thorarchaeota archaeon]|jgi:SAM-dependent methyltransferase
MSDEKELFDLLIGEASRSFTGWDFSYISRTGRIQSEPLPWNYASIIIPYIRRARSLLDMGTGGGEFLSQLHPFPEHVCATESYEPNVPIARNRLEPLGVSVFQFNEDTKLPFRSNEFGLIINRHESYAPLEVKRILESGGYFITQQVGEKNDIEINHLLETEPPPEEQEWNAVSAAKELQDEGFSVLYQKEAFPMTRFYDVGALVYYLMAIPWVVTDFTIEKYSDALLRIHHDILAEGFIEVHEHRFLIISQNTANG